MIQTQDNLLIFEKRRNIRVEEEKTNLKQETASNLYLRLVEGIEEQLGLLFTENDEDRGNVCMANAAETRPDFKTTFTSIHLANYIFALEHSPRHHKEYHQFLITGRIRELYPSDATEF